MKVYYNEFDKKKCAALAQLMAEGHIAKGEIDDRSIRDVQPGDLAGFDRCHFFAGIGLWEYALNLAGWEEDRPVWTGSCPCQPYSTAGRQKAQADDRHLWPEWLRLISECGPPAIFGEQVANAITHGWLDDVYQGLEAQGYACGSAVLPAASVGAPHRRERLFFVANTKHQRSKIRHAERKEQNQQKQTANVVSHGTDCQQPDGKDILPCQFCGYEFDHKYLGKYGCPNCEGEGLGLGYVGQPISQGLQGHPRHGKGINEQGRNEAQPGGSAWASGIWTECPDGKARLIEPGIPLLANGYSERVGIIHCAGDAIVPQVAAEFIKAAM